MHYKRKVNSSLILLKKKLEIENLG